MKKLFKPSKNLKEMKAFRVKLKNKILKGFGKKCGHIGQNKISLDCAVCKSWLAFEFFSWLVSEFEDLERL